LRNRFERKLINFATKYLKLISDPARDSSLICRGNVHDKERASEESGDQARYVRVKSRDQFVFGQADRFYEAIDDTSDLK